MSRVEKQLDALSRRRYLMTLVLFNFKPNLNIKSDKNKSLQDAKGFKDREQIKVDAERRDADLAMLVNDLEMAFLEDSKPKKSIDTRSPAKS